MKNLIVMIISLLSISAVNASYEIQSLSRTTQEIKEVVSKNIKRLETIKEEQASEINAIITDLKNIEKFLAPRLNAISINLRGKLEQSSDGDQK